MAFVNENLLKVTPDQRKRIYEELNVSEQKFDVLCEDLKQWYSLQPHLPQPPPESNVIKTLLIACKMSPEKVKSKLDARCVLRAIRPEFFRFSDLLESGLDTLVKNIYWFPLPKLTETHSRVNILKVVGEPDEFSLEAHFKRSFLIGDYRLKNECCLSDICIIDLANMKWGHIAKTNPLTIKNAAISNKKAYGLRITGIYILNALTYVDKFLVILKKSLNPKMVSRIKCFSSYDELHKDIPKSILPKDYGGDEKSLEELNKEWYNEITREEWKKIFIEEEKLVSDESKRVNSSMDEELLGMQGSFRKLDFD